MKHGGRNQKGSLMTAIAVISRYSGHSTVGHYTFTNGERPLHVRSLKHLSRSGSSDAWVRRV